MKTATSPSSQPLPELRQAPKETQQKLIARALLSHGEARQSGKYVSTDAVVGWLEQMLLNRK
jgi:hypothetical protein